MSHGNVKRDLGTVPHWDSMEPGRYYQLRGWSAVMLYETDTEAYIDLYSYDAHILRYDIRDNRMHAWQFERPHDVSTTTSRHIHEFYHFINTAVNYLGNRFDFMSTSFDYPLKHTPNSWAFRGWSGDYDGSKPFWW